MGKGKGFIQEFQKFISRGNVMDMAVGMIIGSAFTAIIKSLVDDVISPFLGIFGGTLNAAAWVMLSWRKEGKLWVSLALTVILFMSFNTENLITNPYFWLFPVMAVCQRFLPAIRGRQVTDGT